MLGEGGMARVYRAVRTGPKGFRKELAIKRLRTNLTRGNKRLVDALINEAQLGGELHHPNIVDIYEFGVIGDEHYIAMEFVNGLTMASMIAGSRQRQVHLPVGAVLDIALQTCAGLEYAHNRVAHDGRPMNLVHRDLKPSNIIVTTSGQVKIMDFGIARADVSMRRTTTEGVIKGTISFMSPEQLQDNVELDQRSDIFALGAILFEVLTNEPLMVGSSVESILFSVVSGKYMSRVSRVEQRFEEIHPVLRRCLDPDREARYLTVAELAADLRVLREKRGDLLGCGDLMRLLSSCVWESEDHTATVRSEILERARRSQGDEDWAEFLDSLGDEEAEEEDPFTDGIHPPVETLTLEPKVGTPDTMAATVMWRSMDARFSQALTTAAGTRLRRAAPWFLPVVLVLAVIGVAAVFGKMTQSDEETGEVVAARVTDGVAGETAAGTMEGDGEGTEEGNEEGTEEADGNEDGQGDGHGDGPGTDGTAEVAAAVEEDGSADAARTDEQPDAPVPDEPGPVVEQATPPDPAVPSTDAGALVPVTVNSDPWSYWTLSGDAQGGGGTTQVPYVGKLAPGTYHFTLREPQSGSSHVFDVVVTGDEGRIRLCWDFAEGASCKRPQ